MKKYAFLFALMLGMCINLKAQMPGAFKYQAVARDAFGNVITDKTMSVRISILSGATVEYSEVHSVTTNAYGLFSIAVGNGSPEQGDFLSIRWNENSHSLRVEIDPEGGSNFMFIGMSDILAVPYAIHAETVTYNDDADADPTNEIQDLRLVGSILRITGHPSPTYIDLSTVNTDNQMLSYDADNYMLHIQNGNSVNLSTLKEDADADPTNELQTVTQNGAIVTLSHNGGSFSIEDGDPSPTNEVQTLSMTGNTITLSHGGGSVTVVETDGDPANEIQDLAFNNNFLYITNNPSATVIDLNPFMDNTDNQQLAFDEQTGILAIQYGNAVDLSALIDDADADPANELQTISRDGYEIVLSHGGGAVDVRDDDADPNNEIQTLSQNGTVVTLSHGGGTISIADDDSNPMNEIQDLALINDTLVISGNPFATPIDLNLYRDNTDNQTLSLSNDSLLISGGNAVDLSGYLDNTDTQTLALSGTNLSISGGNTIDIASVNTDAQTLSLTGNTLAISGGNAVDLSSYLDNTDAQTLALSGTNLSISGGNTIDIASVNTDAQTLSLTGNTLAISGGNAVDLSSYLDADNMGNHTATQNIRMNGFYLSNDGDNEGIMVLTNGNVNSTGDFFVGNTAASNRDLWISAKVIDWDNSSYYVDPAFKSNLVDLTVDTKMTVNGTLQVRDSDAFYFGDPAVDGTWRIVRNGSNLSFERKESGVWVQKSVMAP
ncbi:MAG: hypothetical protein KatS3mg031_0253 [Chitinophagales bacterium]|nr:MAG: hypothetical protein KatS3mg031_0253 [Chitinophagales bacterium]